MEEIETFKRILRRLKKLSVLIIVIPVLTALVGYFVSSHSKPTYTAEAQIILGNFQDEKMTNIGGLPEFLKTKEFIKWLDDNHALNHKYVANQLLVSGNKGTNTITLSIKGTNEDKVKSSLVQFVTVFMDKSNKVYKESQKVIQDSIDTLEQLNVSQDPVAAVNKQDQLYERKNDLLGLRNSILKAPVDVVSSQQNPLKRGVLGLLVGIMFDIMIIVTPEIFRK